MEGVPAHPVVLVVEEPDEQGERFLVDEVVERLGAVGADARVPVTEADAASGRTRLATGRCRMRRTVATRPQGDEITESGWGTATTRRLSMPAKSLGLTVCNGMSLAMATAAIRAS